MNEEMCSHVLSRLRNFLEIIEKILLPIEDELANRLDTGKPVPEIEPLHFLLKNKQKFNPIIK